MHGLDLLQAQEAMEHPFFDSLDKAKIDEMENPEIRATKRIALAGKK